MSPSAETGSTLSLWLPLPEERARMALTEKSHRPHRPCASSASPRRPAGTFVLTGWGTAASNTCAGPPRRLASPYGDHQQAENRVYFIHKVPAPQAVLAQQFGGGQISAQRCSFPPQRGLLSPPMPHSSPRRIPPSAPLYPSPLRSSC